MVISHDCDISNESLTSEPNVEVIVGRFIQRVDGNFTLGKAPRTLHLSLDVPAAGLSMGIELSATLKQVLPKSELGALLPDQAYRLTIHA